MKKILLLLSIMFSLVLAEKQSVRVTGRLMCHGKPMQYAEMRLFVYRRIRGNVILSENVFTDANGNFDISGYADQYFRIDARLWIWHECFVSKIPENSRCKNWLEFAIPDDFVNRGPIPRATLPMGRVDLKKEQKEDYLDKCN